MKAWNRATAIWDTFPRARRAPTYEYIDDMLAVDLRTVLGAFLLIGRSDVWTRYTMRMTVP